MTARSLTPLALALCLLAPFAVGCGGHGGSGADNGAAAPADALHDLTLGAGLDTDGAIELGWAKREFPLGDPIYLAMDVRDAREDAEIEVRWIGPDGEELDHEVKRALPDRKFMSWRAPESVTLAGVGEYRAQVLYQGTEVATLDFRVTGYQGDVEEAPESTPTPDSDSDDAPGGSAGSATS